ncbi:MAG: M42 family peptidase, partial [Acutalibacteraceae bacterium]|nr:M42 family peptidase [Acutalibacteraceae bacterium]
MEKILTALCESGTVSGNELVDLEVIRQLLPFAKIETDYNNNIIATIGNTNSDDVILLDAHNDRIGFVVSYIDDEGFIKVSTCGGIDRRVL